MPIIDCRAWVGSWPASPADLSPGTLVAAMQGRGVGRAIVSHTTAVFYDPPLGNQAMEAISRQAPALVPAAVINPRHFPGCITEAKRALQAGVTCFRFFPGLHGYTFDARLGALRACLDALQGAKYLHVDFEGGSWNLMSADLADALPAPTVLTVSNEDLGLALAACQQVPTLLLDTSRLTATGALDLAAQAVGAERVLFGSGAPLNSLGSAIMSVQYAELGEIVRGAVLEGNALRLLGG